MGSRPMPATTTGRRPVPPKTTGKRPVPTRGVPCRDQRPLPPGLATSRRPTTPGTCARSAHLHRRAGFGATRAELLRDLAAGPEASVERLFHPPALPPEDAEAIDGLRQTARSSSNLDLLKVCWLNRILHGPDPLREKLTLFWHGHFATSNKKVESVTLMDRQNETLRTHALGGFAAHARGRSSPTRPCWSGSTAATARRTSPTRTSPASSSSCSPWASGTISERDIREAARAFTGWVRQDSRGGFQETPAFTHDAAQVDDGPKTFLGLNGPWGPSDIVRITLERPEAATFLARKLYRWFVSESGTPGPELIEPLAEEVKAAPVRHRADRGGHPAIEAFLLPRGVSPADQVAGRVQRGPGADARGAARRRSTRWRCRPPATRRARSCSPRPTSRAGSAARSGSTAAPCSSAPTGPPTSSGADPRTACRRSIRSPGRPATSCPPDRAAGAFVDLLLQGDLGDEARRLTLEAGRDGSPDGLRKALQRLANCPEFQLS